MKTIEYEMKDKNGVDLKEGDAVQLVVGKVVKAETDTTCQVDIDGDRYQVRTALLVKS